MVKPRVFEIEGADKSVRQNMLVSLQDETGLKDLKLIVHVDGILITRSTRFFTIFRKLFSLVKNRKVC